MEEWLGKMWHKVVSKHDIPNLGQQVSFLDISKELRLMYHLMGGEQHKALYATNQKGHSALSTFMQKLTGDQQRFIIVWQDTKALYLPDVVSFFSSARLNSVYYIWLVAMCAHISKSMSSRNWAEENLRTQTLLLKRYPGFRKDFQLMCDCIFEQRKRDILKFQKVLSSEQELLFKEYVYQDLNNYSLATSQKEYESIDSSALYPFPLWLYPSPLRKLSSLQLEEEELEDEQESKQKQVAKDTVEIRKNAERVDDESETDGLLMFLPEGLMTIAERVNVDRSEDDSDDENAAFNAKDLDEITLGKKKKGLASRLKINLELPTEEIDTYAVGEGILLDEWDYIKEQYLKKYCLLTPIYMKSEQEYQLDNHLQKLANKVKSEFGQYAFNRIKISKSPVGQEIDLDAWINYIASPNMGAQNQNFFSNIIKKERDLSTLILADISLSTESAITTELNILDIIKQSLLVFADSLDVLGDPLALYAFSSLRNTRIRYHILKNFNEKYSAQIRGRIDDLRAGYYTRLGTAIRQSTRILEKQPTANKLMLIISDGKPNDIDRYEGRFGVEDTKKAIYEAKKAGIIPFCITVDSESNSYLPQIFGKNGYSYIRDVKKLPQVLPEIYMNITQ